jgi:hypothetical protein
VRATNASGVLTLQVNAAPVNTNLQLQSLKVFGNQTNVTGLYLGTNFYFTTFGGDEHLVLIDAMAGAIPLSFYANGAIAIGTASNTSLTITTPTIVNSTLVGGYTNIFIGNVRLPSIATNGMLFLDGNSNVVKLGVGSGLSVSGGNLTASGGGGGGGGGPASYVALPTSGLISGTQYGYVTNLSANQMLIVSNLTADIHYFVDVKTAGYVASISNYQSIYFMDAQQGGIASLSTNGVSTLEVWKDSVSGNTNAMVHGPEFALVAAGGVVLSTNNLTRVLTVLGGVTVSMNGVTVGSGTNVNWTSGVTGYVSGATLNLGVTASGSGSGVTNLYSAGNTNTSMIALVHNGTNTTGAVKTITAGGNVTFTDTGTNISIAAASSSLAGTLDTLIVTNRVQHLVQAPTIASTNAVIDLAKSPNVLLTLTTNTHIVFSNVVDGISIGRLIAVQDTNGVRSILSARVVGGNLITNGNPWSYLDTNANALSRWTWASYLATNVILFQDASYSDLVTFTNNLHAGKQATNATLGNIAGTGAITNLFSLTASNATAKPLVVGVGDAAGATNTTGRIRGIEAGSGVTLTPNGSNIVIASTGGASYSIGRGLYLWPDNTLTFADIYDELDNQFISSGNYHGAYLASASGGSAAWGSTATGSSGRLGGRGGLVTLRSFNTNLSSYSTVFWNSVSSNPNQGVMLVAADTVFTMTAGFDTNSVPLTNCPVRLGLFSRFNEYGTAPASGIGWIYNYTNNAAWGCYSVNNSVYSATNWVGPDVTVTSNAMVTFGFKLTSSPTQIVFTTNGVPVFTNSTASTIPTNTVLTIGATLGTAVTNISALTYGFEVDQVALYEK